jgi:hypothetical protein
MDKGGCDTVCSAAAKASPNWRFQTAVNRLPMFDPLTSNKPKLIVSIVRDSGARSGPAAFLQCLDIVIIEEVSAPDLLWESRRRSMNVMGNPQRGWGEECSAQC